MDKLSIGLVSVLGFDGGQKVKMTSLFKNRLEHFDLRIFNW